MPSFEETLKKIQEQGEELVNRGTMQWYLDQIKLLAASAGVGEHDPKIKEGAVNIGIGTEETKKHSSDTQNQRQKLRDEVANTRVIETTNTFDPSKIGKIAFYQYYPKTQAKLKYWDMFPLVVPFSYKPDGWIGCNLHYLPLVYRARLLAQLMTLANTMTVDPLTRMNVTYAILNKSSRFEYFKPTIKRYLIRQVRSRIMWINPAQWVNVALMPLANFQKQDEMRVWQDSVDKIRSSQGQWKNG